jgi:hypothetical protein
LKDSNRKTTGWDNPKMSRALRRVSVQQ